ncbi:MAG: oligosaccharide flippase family protein [Myxococcota bacterium]|nr:oligosaccharide flippase family protein [Myxococcota bacterium]
MDAVTAGSEPPAERGLAPPDPSADAEAEGAAGEAPEGIETYEKRAVRGGLALTIRTGVAQVIVLGGTVVLARHLRPAEFGAFAMVQFALTALTIFGDAGLGGALIQKKKQPTQRELSSVFFVQVALGAVVLLAAGGVGQLLPIVWPDLPEGTPWIMSALALSFVFTSLRVVPMLLMERELLFVRVAILDTVNSVTFYLVAGVLAVRGAGIWALVIGVLAQGTTGLVGALLLRPWRPSSVFDREAVRALLGFGVPFQTRTALGLVIASVIPVVGGTLLGAEAVGYINWSHQTAFFALTFVDIIARVSFPLYSRLHAQGDGLPPALERSLRVCVALTLFFSGMFLGIGEPLTRIIYSESWVPAVPLLHLYAATITVGMLVNVLAPAFDALGRPRIVLAQMIVVTIGTWIVVPIATVRWGLIGFTAGYVSVMVLGAVLIVWLARRFLPRTRILQPFVAPAIAAALILALGRWLLAPWTTGPWTLAAAVLAEVLIFTAIVAALDRATLRALRSLLPARRARPD